jgi:DNA-binding transcriptional MocR family regulator
MQQTRSQREPEEGLQKLQLPDGVDAADVARRAIAENVLFAPGNVFSPSQSAGAFLRFNVAQCSDERIFATLAAAIDRR